MYIMPVYRSFIIIFTVLPSFKEYIKYTIHILYRNEHHLLCGTSNVNGAHAEPTGAWVNLLEAVDRNCDVPTLLIG